MSPITTLPEDTGTPHKGPGEPLRIVIADDEHDAVLSLSEIFRDSGHETRGVYRGDQVVDAILGFGADVALVDLMMPGMTGLDVAREMRRRCGAAAPLLVAVTAWNTSSDRILARASGFDEHVGKPYDPADLLALVEQRARERRVRGQGVAAPFTFGGAPDTLHSRLLRKLTEVLGDTEAVRHALKVPASDMSRWLAGAELMPAAVFVKATDLLLNSTPLPRGGPGPLSDTDRRDATDDDSS